MGARKPRSKQSSLIPNIETDDMRSVCAASFAGLGIILTARFDLHLSLHIVSVFIATLLVVVSWRSYFRDPRSKVCLLALAFLFLDLHQLLELFGSLGITYVNFAIPVVGIELIHAVSFATVVLLAAGILKK